MKNKAWSERGVANDHNENGNGDQDEKDNNDDMVPKANKNPISN